MLTRSKLRLLCFAILACTVGHATSAGAGPTEYQLKAAFLYNFIKFVEWPTTSQTGPLTLCVLGKDPFDGELERATDGKTVNGRPMIIRRLNDAAAAQSCQVLFVSSSEAGRAPEVLKRVAGLS